MGWGRLPNLYGSNATPLIQNGGFDRYVVGYLTVRLVNWAPSPVRESGFWRGI
jgi:hypothetical protein